MRNRRLHNADGSYRGMGPNADKPVDDTVPVLRISSPDGKTRAFVFGCACHAVTFGPENLELSGSGIEPISVTQLATHTSGFDNTKSARARIGDAALASLGY